jgi:crotonobetaine/carnitine-CoA ligase
VLDRDLVLPHLMAKRAAQNPGRTFLVDVEGPSMTYGQVHDAVLTWAGAYGRAGVREGDKVVTMMPSKLDAYFAWVGLAWLRAVEVPINFMYFGQQLQYIVDNSTAETVVVSERFLPQLVDVLPELPHVRTIVVPDADGGLPDVPVRLLGRDAFLGGASPATDLEGPSHYDISCIIYTSGTTGPSKGVLVPWASIFQFANSVNKDIIGEDEALYSFFPAFHVSGKNAIYMPAYFNGRVVQREWFSVEKFWDDIRAHNCRAAGLVGPMAQFLMVQPERPDDADNPLEHVTMGPVIPQVEQFKKRFGVKVSTGYGMTEIGAPLATGSWELPNAQSCDRVRSGYEVRIVDEHDEEVPVGEVGEFVIRSDEPWVLNAGYFNMPERTAEAWRNGWFHTGDGFKRDEDGNYYFVDRMKDAIRRRGENISSFEVEGFVNQHPAVQESAALGVPSEFMEDEVKVCVVVKAGETLTPEELIEFLIPKMPRFMVPRYVEIVSELPKTQGMLRTRKFELKDSALNDKTWDREAAGITIPR